MSEIRKLAHGAAVATLLFIPGSEHTSLDQAVQKSPNPIEQSQNQPWPDITTAQRQPEEVKIPPLPAGTTFRVLGAFGLEETEKPDAQLQDDMVSLITDAVQRLSERTDAMPQDAAVMGGDPVELDLPYGMNDTCEVMDYFRFQGKLADQLRKESKVPDSDIVISFFKPSKDFTCNDPGVYAASAVGSGDLQFLYGPDVVQNRDFGLGAAEHELLHRIGLGRHTEKLTFPDYKERGAIILKECNLEIADLGPNSHQAESACEVDGDENAIMGTHGAYHSHGHLPLYDLEALGDVTLEQIETVAEHGTHTVTLPVLDRNDDGLQGVRVPLHNDMLGPSLASALEDPELYLHYDQEGRVMPYLINNNGLASGESSFLLATPDMQGLRAGEDLKIQFADGKNVAIEVGKTTVNQAELTLNLS